MSKSSAFLESAHASHINTAGDSLKQILEIQARLDSLAAGENRCAKSVTGVHRHILQLKDRFKQTQIKLKEAEQQVADTEQELEEKSLQEIQLKEKLEKLQSDNANIKDELATMKAATQLKLKVRATS